jgi:tetratricopeptide (TPR) repeat protein
LALPAYAPRAIEAYRVLAQKHPTLLQPHLALADLYKQTGQLDLARQEMEQTVRLAPNDFMAQLNLVNFYSENGQIDAAVNTMRRVVSLVPPARPDYARFAEFFNQLQILQRDIQTVQQSPNDVNTRRTLAVRWKARGQAPFAIPEYQAIARLAPNDYDAHKNLVLLNLQSNHLDDAQRALITAVTLSPDNDKPLWQNVQAAINAHKAN